MFQIFERINTSGRTLSSQEIRNCVYHGKFNHLLVELNKNQNWRELLNCDEDIRMSDMENILRFFAISDIQNTSFYNKNQIILKKFLNEYMASHSDISDYEYSNLKSKFETIMKIINEKLGSIAFNNLSFKCNDIQNNFSNVYVSKFHPTIFEAITSAFLFAYNHIDIHSIESTTLKTNHINLLNNEEFKEAISFRTTNLENIKKRITLATNFLFGLNYEWK